MLLPVVNRIDSTVARMAPDERAAKVTRSLPALNIPPEEFQRLRRDNALRLFLRLQG